jgi:hypothetical protein
MVDLLNHHRTLPNTSLRKLICHVTIRPHNLAAETFVEKPMEEEQNEIRPKLYVDPRYQIS